MSVYTVTVDLKRTTSPVLLCWGPLEIDAACSVCFLRIARPSPPCSYKYKTHFIQLVYLWKKKNIISFIWAISGIVMEQKFSNFTKIDCSRNLVYISQISLAPCIYMWNQFKRLQYNVIKCQKFKLSRWTNDKMQQESMKLK